MPGCLDLGEKSGHRFAGGSHFDGHIYRLRPRPMRLDDVHGFPVKLHGAEYEGIAEIQRDVH